MKKILHSKHLIDTFLNAEKGVIIVKKMLAQNLHNLRNRRSLVAIIFDDCIIPEHSSKQLEKNCMIVKYGLLAGHDVGQLPVTSIEELRERILPAAEDIKTSLSTRVPVSKVCHSLRACIRNNGRQFEQDLPFFLY